MQNKTPLFPGIHLASLRRRRRSDHEKIKDELAAARIRDHDQAAELFGRYLPHGAMRPSAQGAHSRRRIFSKGNTFWAFLHQVQSADKSTMEAVRYLQVSATLKHAAIPASATNAYCHARKKLCVEELSECLKHTASYAQGLERSGWNGRRLLAVDGTFLSAPDTPENQQAWPQSENQSEGCGFPLIRLCGVFALDSGVLMAHRIGNKHHAEVTLFRDLQDELKPGDIMLGDRVYGAYSDLATLKSREIDAIVVLHQQRKPTSATQALEVLGEGDLLVKWTRSRSERTVLSKVQINALPKTLKVRQITFYKQQPGHRTEPMTLITTLLDARRYPADEIIATYLRRWEAETCFADLKTTLGMDILRCKSPAMIEKELIMHLLSHNLIRIALLESLPDGQHRGEVSFKAALQLIRRWLGANAGKPVKRSDWKRILRQLLSDSTVQPRPNRQEPRNRKRRPKPFPPLKQPRTDLNRKTAPADFVLFTLK